MQALLFWCFGHLIAQMIAIDSAINNQVLRMRALHCGDGAGLEYLSSPLRWDEVQLTSLTYKNTSIIFCISSYFNSQLEFNARCPSPQNPSDVDLHPNLTRDLH